MTTTAHPAHTTQPGAATRSLGLGVVMITAALIVVGLVWGTSPLTDQVAVGLWLVVTATVAGVVIAHRPRSTVGWLLASVAVAVALQGAALATAQRVGGGPLHDVAAWTSHWSALPGFGALGYIVLLFPSGRPPTPRWRWVTAVLGAGLASLTIVTALQPTTVGGLDIANPFGVTAWEAELKLLADASSLVIFVGAVGAVTSLVVRLRRARGDERQQVKWFLYGSALLVTSLLFAGAASGPLNQLSFVLALLGLSAVPVTIGLAVLEFHLYDLDRVINRTLVYLALTLAVVALYIGVVAVASITFDRSLGVGASLVATGVVVVAVAPLRDRLQRIVDRLVYGQRNDRGAAIATLASHLQHAPDPARVPQELVDVVAASLKLPHVAIELDEGSQLSSTTAHGRRPEAIERFPITWQDQHLGDLVVGADAQLREPDRVLLRDLLGQAAPAIAATRLTRALEQSRNQLVLAREEERRRLRHDLHDGLGPQLAGLAMGLDAVGNTVEDDPSTARHLVDRLRVRSQEALDTVRAVTHGLRPPVLDDLGLVGALQQHADQLTTRDHRVVFSLGAGVGGEQLPAAVELATYNLCLEAVTNATRHAAASWTAVRLERSAIGIRVTITDDGIGISDDHRPGVGLRSMRSRVEELGGTFSVGPGAGAGTCVVADLPLGAT